MGNANDETITRLEQEWPAWQIWVVHRVYGGPVWCARRWSGEGSTLNAHSAAELAEYLGELCRSDPAGPDAHPEQS